jgi:hypothetical protein
VGGIEALLEDEPATALLPGELVSGLGEVDFTPAGAALYRAVAGEFLGPGWDEGLRVWKELYREEHRYAETEQDVRAASEEYEASGKEVLSSQVVPLGPWCLYWWERFPRGYRLEVKIGGREVPPLGR